MDSRFGDDLWVSDCGGQPLQLKIRFSALEIITLSSTK